MCVLFRSVGSLREQDCYYSTTGSTHVLEYSRHMAFVLAAAKTGLIRGLNGKFKPIVNLSRVTVKQRSFSQQTTTEEDNVIGEDLMHPAQPESHLPRWPHTIAYPHYTEEQIKLYWDGIIEQRTNILPRDRPNKGPDLGPKVDPQAEPFKDLYEEGSEIVAKSREVPDVWFWVQRLLPQPPPKFVVSDDPKPLPSGWIPPPAKHPDKTYFIARNKFMDYPVAKVLERVHVTGVRLDARVLEPPPIVTTELTHISGAIRDAEADLLEYLYDASGYKNKKKILSAVDEWGGAIKIKGDFVFLVVEWLQKSGF